jgi:hypothetical protein
MKITKKILKDSLYSLSSSQLLLILLEKIKDYFNVTNHEAFDLQNSNLKSKEDIDQTLSKATDEILKKFN